MWIFSVFRNSMKIKGSLRTKTVSVAYKMIPLSLSSWQRASAGAFCLRLLEHPPSSLASLILHTVLLELNSHLSLDPGTQLVRWERWTLIYLSSLAAEFKGVSFVPHLSPETRQTRRPPEENIPFCRGADSSFGYRSWLKSFDGAQGNSEFELLGKQSESGQKCSLWPEYQCHSQYSTSKMYFPMR